MVKRKLKDLRKVGKFTSLWRGETEEIPIRAKGSLNNLTKEKNHMSYFVANGFNNFPIKEKFYSFITLNGMNRYLHYPYIHPSYMKSIFKVHDIMFNLITSTTHDDHLLVSLLALRISCNYLLIKHLWVSPSY